MSEEIPEFIFFNGEIVPWHAAKIHVWSETAIRATNVFEGARAYWNDERGAWNLVAWPEHMARRQREDGAQRVHRYDYRAENMKVGCYVAAFPVPRSGQLKPCRCMVSSWQRFSDLSGAPPRVKCGANYQNIRFPRIEATQRGFDDAILLNHQARSRSSREPLSLQCAATS